jgi:3-oxoacyl-ACP reductase-like protein
MTGWIDDRLNVFAKNIGDHIADRIIERTGLHNISDQLGAFLLGVNGTIGDMLLDRDA